MADRNRPSNFPGNRVPTQNEPQRPRGAPHPAAVRRNLFQSSQHAKAARRPAPAPSNSSETLRLDLEAPSSSDSSEIVVRDRYGEIELGDPPTPVFEEQADVPQDSRHESERMYLGPLYLSFY